MHPKIIAIIWDFDKTLIAGYMQEPLFAHYGVDAVQFWDEVNALPAFHAQGIDGEPFIPDSIYLNHMLSYVRSGIFGGLSNKILRGFGAQQRLAPGVPAVFEDIARRASAHAAFQTGAIQIEHYVVSTGLRQIVLGSAVAPFVRHVWGCEFLEHEAAPGFLNARAAGQPAEGEIRDIGYVIDDTTKTRAIFEINKGVRENLGVNVNSHIPLAERRVPFENMIYVADGPSDIPSFAVINQFGGRTLGVYLPQSDRDLAQAQQLLAQGRVQQICPADYRRDAPASEWLCNAVVDIAERLARTPQRAATSPVAPTPGHIYKD